jgi:RNA polymerase sigma factor (sigma-70 family)
MYVKEMTEAVKELDIESIEFEHRRYKEFGDIDSRNKLVVRCMPLVMSVLRTLDVGRDLVDDCIQAGNLAVIGAIESWDTRNSKSLTSWVWLYIQTYMLREVKFLTEMEHFEPLQFVNPENDEELLDNPDLPGIPFTADAEILKEQMYASFGQLTDTQRLVVEMVLDGHTEQRIANSMNISQQAVSRTYDRAVSSLRRLLNP